MPPDLVEVGHEANVLPGTVGDKIALSDASPILKAWLESFGNLQDSLQAVKVVSLPELP
jgi:hypothetical protein